MDARAAYDLVTAGYQDEMEAWLREAGFEGVETLERDPNPDVEKPTRRSYIFARKPV